MATKLQVYAQHVGNRWIFYQREKRFDVGRKMKNRPLEDWLELLDSVRRRINRRLLRPEEEGRVVKRIRELFPEAEIPRNEYDDAAILAYVRNRNASSTATAVKRVTFIRHSTFVIRH